MSKNQKIIVARLACATLLFIVLIIAAASIPMALYLFIVPYLIVGYDVLYDAVRNVFSGHMLDEKFLMGIATVGAIILGEYPEAFAVMALYQAGELFCDIAVGKSRKSIAALMDIRPDYAVVIRNNKEMKTEPYEVLVGETIIVRPGERIPLDGTVCEGETKVDTSALTGESLPRTLKVGDRASGGTVNLEGVIKIKVESIYEESTVSKILELVENAAEKKAKTERFITRFAHVYTPIVVGCAILLAILPPIILKQEFSEWIYRGLLFLVVSCPCALVISVPMSFFGGIGAASSRGILVKGSAYIEQLARAEHFVFDKTGTLTKGVFEVTEICCEDCKESELLELAAYAESNSNHPIARSVCMRYKGIISPERIVSVKEISGKGIEAQLLCGTVLCGNAKLLEDAGVDFERCSKSGTVVYIALNSKYMGYILISDVIKENTKAAIEELRNKGIDKLTLLTGDRKEVGEETAEALSIDNAICEQLPDDKVSSLEKIMAEATKGSVVFVGDGINDAPVLARADVGVSMGALGSDAAIEAADVVLMDDDPAKLAQALEISRFTMQIAKQNIIFALGVKVAILLLSAVGLGNMWLAVFADVGVSAIAVANSLRTLRGIFKK